MEQTLLFLVSNETTHNKPLTGKTDPIMGGDIMKKDVVQKIVDEAIKSIDDIENICVELLNEQYDDGKMSDEDLYFLTTMLSLTRQYGNMVYNDLPALVKEDKNEEDS